MGDSVMKTKIELGKPVRYKINNTIVNSVYYSDSVCYSVVSSVSIPVTNSVWSSVDNSVWRSVYSSVWCSVYISIKNRL